MPPGPELPHRTQQPAATCGEAQIFGISKQRKDQNARDLPPPIEAAYTPALAKFMNDVPMTNPGYMYRARHGMCACMAERSAQLVAAYRRSQSPTSTRRKALARSPLPSSSSSTSDRLAPPWCRERHKHGATNNIGRMVAEAPAQWTSYMIFLLLRKRAIVPSSSSPLAFLAALLALLGGHAAGVERRCVGAEALGAEDPGGTLATISCTARRCSSVSNQLYTEKSLIIMPVTVAPSCSLNSCNRWTNASFPQDSVATSSLLRCA